ncbi:hypothetical protein PIB30_051403 [Stylosanthes scabra]|uniref:Uncharacterized protein n=1 Tax=Stylosanthes scabra TaxID=79078 RepID=A0ABU6VGE4_9FABA|nr:hypothetical protein [Stylosanthes scabra]
MHADIINSHYYTYRRYRRLGRRDERGAIGKAVDISSYLLAPQRGSLQKPHSLSNLTPSLSSRRAPFSGGFLPHRSSICNAVIAVVLLVLGRFLRAGAVPRWGLFVVLLLGVAHFLPTAPRDPTGLFAVEIVCVCTVFNVGNKKMGHNNRDWMYDWVYPNRGGFKPSFVAGLAEFLNTCTTLEEYTSFGKVRFYHQFQIALKCDLLSSCPAPAPLLVCFCAILLIPKENLLEVLGPSRVYKEVIKKIINSSVAEYMEKEWLMVSTNLRVEQSFEDLECRFEVGE